MSTAQKVMLLIDADNLSADVITQALAAVLADHGAAHVRRAYCTAESAVTPSRVSVRPGRRPSANA